jgi:nicotinamidase-related amidase
MAIPFWQDASVEGGDVGRNRAYELAADGWFGIADSEWVAPNATALLIIDMQNYDANEEWRLIGSRGTGVDKASDDYFYDRISGTVIPAIARLLSFFRQHELCIAHVFFASSLLGADDMPSLWRLRFDQHAEDAERPFRPHVAAPEMQIVDPLRPLPDEIVMPKVTGSAFLSTNLDRVLRTHAIRSFLACGTWGNSCVEDTIRSGCDLGYLATLVEDGCASPDPAFHDASVRVLGEMYSQVRTADWIIERMSKLIEGDRKVPRKR